MNTYVNAGDQLPGTTHTLIAGQNGSGVIRRTVLPGGLRVVTETMPSVRSVTFGIWTGIGSRDEKPEESGATHYLEHLLFKGTPTRSALEISAAIDAVGGEMNAFTAKEYTCYYARVLDTDLPLAIDVICDLVTSAVIRPEDVHQERNVILEEMAMTEDEPGDLIHDEFAYALLGDSPLGRPILGSIDSVNALTRDAIAEYYHARYTDDHLVVSAAGNLEHDMVVALVDAAFQKARGQRDTAAQPVEPRIGGTPDPTFHGLRLLTKQTEQTHVVLGVPGVARTDMRRYPLGILSTILGGGMSSRLFQEVREKRGLAYSVYSFSTHYSDMGMFGVYAGCQPENFAEVLKICRDELQKVAEHGVTEDELRRGIGQVRGSTVLSLEDTGSQMTRIGKNELVYGEHLTIEELLGRVEAVTVDDVRRAAAEFLTQPQAIAVIGEFEDSSSFEGVLA
jgi:predicted Zn-dependent peptidase